MRTTDGRTRLRWLQALVVLLALAAITTAVLRLEQAAAGLEVQRLRVGTVPVTVYRPQASGGASTGPVVLIAHGFAGSQQLMQPFALTLARNGYTAVNFDFPGHGRNPAPMRGGLADPDASQRVLLATMNELAGFVAGLAGPGARYALVGHSMASDIVVRHAQADPAVQATVAVSLFAPSITPATPPDSPRNLLVVDGALEPGVMLTEALRVVARVAGDAAQPETRYGRFEDGTARRATLAPGVEHIGVLYSAHTLGEALRWLDAAFDRPSPPAPFIDARGPWLGLLLAGVLGLAWPLARLLPRVAPAAAREPLGWRRCWPVAVVPMLATPLLLWPLPSDLLPILLGDYLVLHFALYGLLTALALGWLRRRLPGRAGGPWHARAAAPALAWAVALATAWGLFAIGLPVDRHVFNLAPEPVRWPLIAALCAGTLPWFLADEWFSRAARAPRGAYLVTKLCFLLSLVLAIALNPGRLFFLAIIVPAILLLFIVYGLFSRWAFAASGHPAVAATANGLCFGWFIAVTFPLVR